MGLLAWVWIGLVAIGVFGLLTAFASTWWMVRHDKGHPWEKESGK